MREFYQAFRGAERLNRKKQKGFTLIELLVVIAIIAILAAIAIPQFAKYRVRAFNSAAESDLRNIRTTMEAIYADFQSYGNVSLDDQSGIVVIADGTVGFSENVGLSKGVYLDLISSNTHYLAGTVHNQGDRRFCTDSDITNLYFEVLTSPTSDPNITSAGNYQQNDCPGNPL